MNPEGTWKLKIADDTMMHFIDIRRKVGNRVLRAYLLKDILEADRIEKVKATLRGPKSEFKDFAKFMVLRITEAKKVFHLLAESGVYENLRVVGVDDIDIAGRNPEDLLKVFTSSLQNPATNNASLILSIDTNVRAG
ncbi:MAG: hypothetical protein ACXADL_04955 [Candidatus Thorarchaeota archaeon]